MKSSQGCRGSLSTDLQHNNPVPGQPHNHSPEESSVNLARLRNNMQEKALSTHNAPSRIFAECVSTTSNAVKSMLPVEENCKKSIRRHRPQLPSPSSLQQLTIPPEFAVTLDEDPQPFLFYDNGPDARTRVIAFATEDNLMLYRVHLATDQLYHIMLYRVHLNTNKLDHIMLYRVHLTTDKLYHIMLYRVHLTTDKMP